LNVLGAIDLLDVVGPNPPGVACGWGAIGIDPMSFKSLFNLVTGGALDVGRTLAEALGVACSDVDIDTGGGICTGDGAGTGAGEAAGAGADVTPGGTFGLRQVTAIHPTPLKSCSGRSKVCAPPGPETEIANVSQTNADMRRCQWLRKIHAI
jgi:hypothetical protein